MIKDDLKKAIQEALTTLGLNYPESRDIHLEYPEDFSHGDYSTNIAMAAGSRLGKSPRAFAEEFVAHFTKPDFIEKIEIAGPGFINFYLTKEFFAATITGSIAQGAAWGTSNYLEQRKTIIEYTDPNPFKEFHIGHLMPNVIGEALSRALEWSGAEIKRANYQGDVGMHVAKAVHGIKLKEKDLPADDAPLLERAKFLGVAYAAGATAYESSAATKAAIQALNKKIYERSDSEINQLYDMGKSWSLEYFELMYAKLGTHFDFYFFESETGEWGKQIVSENIGTIFEKSDGAVVFRGEQYDSSLHTRVFLNSEGLPTYEAKELGLAKLKADVYPYESSIVITGNEINDYFKVLLAAMRQVFPDLAAKTRHLSHGMLRLPSGKMSSRTGDVITAESLISAVRERALEKMSSTSGEWTDVERHIIAEEVAIGAIKYSILRQSPGRDVIFDMDKSLSFEGDSGPYLQYTYVRTRSVLDHATQAGIIASAQKREDSLAAVERMLPKFPEVVVRAGGEFAPQYLVTYLTELAGAFNAYYADHQIVDSTSTHSAYRVALTQAVGLTIKNGLTVLGIRTPERM